MKNLIFNKTKGNLLNYDNNAKTVKGQKKGYKTAILYLAPHIQSGFNVCPQASKGCSKSCLYTSGMGIFSNVQLGRINKTRWFIQERESFLEKLTKEIKKFSEKCKRENFKPCVRLNGTSDISFENFEKGGNISAVFRDFIPKKYEGFRVVNGDETDLRFLDPKNCIVGLIAKGKGKKDYSGFVLDN